jgi:hypothetical protein
LSFNSAALRRRGSECEVPPLGIGVQAIQLSPYHAGLAGRHLRRLPVTPAFRACRCPLRLSPSGKPDGPGTFLRVPPGCARDSAPRLAAHAFALIQLPGGWSLSRHPGGSSTAVGYSDPPPGPSSFGAWQLRHPASGPSPCPRYTPVAGVLRRMTPSGDSALHPLVSPVSLSAGSPGGLRFWAHPSPRPIRRTG